MIPGVEEVGKTTRSFFDALKDQPLSLALVVVILAMAFLVYYQTSQTLQQRAAMTDLIVNWQRETDKIMSSCVSMDVTKLMLDNMQKITETMIKTAQGDLTRMQEAIDKERELNRKLIDEQLKRLQQYQPPPGLSFTPHRNISDPLVVPDPAHKLFHTPP